MARALAIASLLAAALVISAPALAGPAAPAARAAMPALAATLVAAQSGNSEAPSALAATIGWIGAGIGLRLRKRRRAG